MSIKNTLITAFVVFIAVFAAKVIENYFVAQDTSPAMTATQGEKILQELAALRSKLEDVEKRLPAPRKPVPKTATVPFKNRPTMGAADANVTVVELTDYQCPYCRRFATNTFSKLKETYIDTGKVRWVVLNLPLSFHKDALLAATAAACANEQNKFWEFRELLYMNQNKLKAEDLKRYADSIGIEAEAFNICINSNRYRDTIDSDTKAANKEGITGTPTFVIGRSTTAEAMTGRRIVGAQPLRNFTLEIEKLLKVKT